MPPRAFDLLVRLVEAEGRLLSKAQLLNEVWQDRLVEEGTLSRHIWLLRQAFGDAADLLETVPKAGYRLRGVHRDLPLEATVQAGQSPAEGGLGRTRAVWHWPLLILLLIGIGGYGAYRLALDSPSTGARIEQAQLLGLRAQSLVARRSEADLLDAVQLYRQAIELAPDQADLHAGLAVSLALVSGTALPANSYESARSQAQRALQLDANNVDAMAVLGLIAMNRDRDWSAAETQFRRALAIAPGHVRSHHWLGELLVLLGVHQDEGLAELQTAHRLAPSEVAIASDLAKAAYFSRRYEEAIGAATRAIELDSAFAHSYRWRALAQLELGRCEAALKDARDAVKLDHSSIVRAEQIFALGRCNGPGSASALAATMESEAAAGYISPIALMLVRLGIDDYSGALQALEEAVSGGNMVLGLATAPALDRLRAEPRFIALLERLRDLDGDVSKR